MSKVRRISRYLAERLAARVGFQLDPELIELRNYEIFDAKGYLNRYPDVASVGADPLSHYLRQGAAERRIPCELFDTAYYLDSNQDVLEAGINPLLHYCRSGWKEGRNPSAGFDATWYTNEYLANPDDSQNPLLHYLKRGRAQGNKIKAVPNPVRDAIAESGLFDPDFYLASYTDVRESGMEPLDHYIKHGARECRAPSPYFDPDYYLKRNPDVAATGENPLYHFCTIGWKELRNPSAQFDVWWYWTVHLDPASETINPLSHYASTGQAHGLETRPPHPRPQFEGDGYRHASPDSLKRICLFAGYDPDGLIDEYVVEYLRELSLHADVYYLADCELQPGELEKISDAVKGAWCERHGEYDFGSYSRLARERIGWEVIEQYDELILANDSCYLLRDLGPIFAKMDAKACDWWGMQATKGIAATRRSPRNQFPQPIAMETVRRALLGTFENDSPYDFLVGSYFVVYRRPVISDRMFRKIIDSVTAQESKRNVIMKYEIGLTRYLVSAGFALDTFIGSLYPFHPIYGSWYFRLLEEGFPFLKRYLLSENHYRVPRLGEWIERGLRKFPHADVDAMLRNLRRVTEPEKLHRTLHIGSSELREVVQPSEETLLNNRQFAEADHNSPKYSHWWAFPICAFTEAFTGNERAVFEEVKNDPSIKKIVLTRDRAIEVDGIEVEVAPLVSPRGQYLLMRSGNIFIKHSPTRNLIYPVASDLHNIINLWHGIPYKRIGYASLDMQDKQEAIAREHSKCRAVISSSRIDTLAMSAAFYPLSYAEVWPTGLPRNDFILRSFELLPQDMRREGALLYDLMQGRKLILFLPTFRNAQEAAYYRFSDRELSWLDTWLRKNDAVLGIREHMADQARIYSKQLASLPTIDLSDSQFPNVELLYRQSSALITDYSSCFIDYMLTGKPAISFAFDFDSYSSIERGAFYDLDYVFPGPVCRTFDELGQALERLFEVPTEVEKELLEWKRRMFFDHIDDGSSARVVERVNRLTESTEIGKKVIH